jgi:RimJ/RimL family protein N-acetyltransferase
MGCAARARAVTMGHMPWFLSDSLPDYSATVDGLLSRRPAQHTILLGAIEALRASGTTSFGAVAPLFGWWQEPDGEVSAAFLHTPPFGVALTSVPPPAAAALAEALAARRRTANGVNADPPGAEAFARAWHERTGDAIELHMRNRLYQLGELGWPDPRPPGRARLAGPADRGLLIAWTEAFHREAQSGPGDGESMVDERLSYRGLTLWEDAGQPVSMAGLTRPAAGQVRVGPVYTPPGLRGKGYAGAVTCVVSQAARDAGASRVLLFTDLGNPTSNALYQRLGYEPVEDRVIWSFHRSPAGDTSGRAGS